MSGDLEEVVGVRFEPRGPLRWHRAAGVAATTRSWVVVENDEGPRVGEVVVGQGQCLGFPGDPDALPPLSRLATEAEIPPLPRRAGRALLESLHLGPLAAEGEP